MTYSSKRSLAFPSPNSRTYSSLVSNLTQEFSPEIPAEPLEKLAERVMLNAFSDELSKLGFIPQLAGTALRNAALGEFGMEAVNRLLWGNQAERSPMDMAKSIGMSTLVHLPFGAAAHVGVPKLDALSKSLPDGSWKQKAVNAGSGTLNFMSGMTAPMGLNAMTFAVPALGYALSGGPKKQHEQAMQQIPPIEPSFNRSSI